MEVSFAAPRAHSLLPPERHARSPQGPFSRNRILLPAEQFAIVCHRNRMQGTELAGRDEPRAQIPIEVVEASHDIADLDSTRDGLAHHPEKQVAMPEGEQPSNGPTGRSAIGGLEPDPTKQVIRRREDPDFSRRRQEMIKPVAVEPQLPVVHVFPQELEVYSVPAARTRAGHAVIGTRRK